MVLFSEIGRLKIYHSPTRLIECVSKYKFLISKKTPKKPKQASKQQQQNKTKTKTTQKEEPEKAKETK